MSRSAGTSCPATYMGEGGHSPVLACAFEGTMTPIAVHRIVVPASGPGSIRVVAEVHVCRNCGSLFMDAGNRAKLGGA